MSGVIDDSGQQWERCNECAAWIKIQSLGYEKPTPQHKYGRDLCVKCVDKGIREGSIKFENVEPSDFWVRYEEHQNGRKYHVMPSGVRRRVA